MKRRFWVIALFVLACDEATTPSPGPLTVRIASPTAGALLHEGDTALFVGDAAGEEFGLVPDDSVWWTLDGAAIGTGHLLRWPVVGGGHELRFSAQYNTQSGSAVMTLLVAGKRVGSIRWAVRLDSSSYDGVSIGPSGAVYALDDDGEQLVAVSPDGAELWRLDLGVYATPPAVIGPDGTIYFGQVGDYEYTANWTTDGGIIAIAPEGRVKWVFDTRTVGPPGSAYYHVHGNPAVGSDGTVYFGTEETNGPMYAVNPDGSLKWRVETGVGGYYVELNGPVTLVGDSLVVSLLRGDGGQVVAVTTDSGVLRWRRPYAAAAYSPTSGAAIGADGTIYFAQYALVAAFSPSGDTVFMRPGTGLTSGSPALRAGLLYVSTVLGGIQTYSATTGQFGVTMGQGSASAGGAPALAANGVVYALGQDTLYSYAVNGSLRFATAIPNRWAVRNIRGALAIGADGTIYVRAGQYGIIAIRDTVGPDPTADWPTYQGGMGRQGRH